MTWKAHLIGGAQAGLLTIAALKCGSDYTETLIVGSSAVLGSLLSDLDQPKSKLSRSDVFVGLISHLTAKFTKHRGFTHTVPGAALFGGIFYLLSMLQGGGAEGLYAFFAALAVFVILHASDSPIKPLAGCISAAIYLSGPQIAGLITESGLSVDLGRRSAMLCALGVFAGSLSHIWYDFFNKGGVPLLWPISKKNYRLMEIKTNTAGEFWFITVQIIIMGLMFAGAGVGMFT